MSFLFPLYALGAMAIAAPILFHLFQRKPHGQQDFSSLMFLKETPPKLTRRSRLSDLFLLLLRGLALALVAAAFARPFLRSAALLDLDAPARNVALLVDTSASMRRTGAWEGLQQTIEKVVSDLRPTDQVMLLAFDREPTTLVSFEAWADTLPPRRIPLLKEQIRGLKPSWHATDLSAAMIAASDALLQARMVEDYTQALQLVVFSDLQEGCDLTGLQSYQWPEEVTVDFRTGPLAKPTNASMQVLPPEASDIDSSQVRVLVRNEPNSQHGQFQLSWDTDQPRPIDVYVTPGQTRTVRLTQPPGATRLTLQGDDHQFDNELFVAETLRQKKKVLYIGDDLGEGATSAYFYLRQCSLDNRTREVSISRLEDLTRLATILPAETPLVVISKPIEDMALDHLKRYVSRGGRLLVVLADLLSRRSADPVADRSPSSSDEGEIRELDRMAFFLSQLLELPSVRLEPVDTGDYAMFAEIDFQNPLFKPFADPRFNDFTKIQFWSHLRLISDDPRPWKTIARFDDQSPAIVQRRLEKGIVWVFSSGWQPEVSQLALSTKFVPLMHGFFGQSSLESTAAESYDVGQPINLSPLAGNTTVITPDGEVIALPAMAESFEEASQPGMYAVQQGQEQHSIAVNLPTEESRTQPLPLDRMEQLGLQLGKQRTVDAITKEQRQMRSKELEGRQKLWRFGIAAALVAVTLETWLGGRRSMSSVSES